MTDNEMFDLYRDYLISAFGQTTATGLSALLDGLISHDRIRRFLAGTARTSADGWHLVKPHVRECCRIILAQMSEQYAMPCERGSNQIRSQKMVLDTYWMGRDAPAGRLSPRRWVGT